nr:type 4a pilus biogenesis protein PilO [Candidatus Omnitrophota bacterium]
MKFIPENKKNLALIAVLLGAGILLFYFIYLPKVKEVKSLNAEYRSINRELDELYSFLGGERDLKDNIIKLRVELAKLENTFPHEKEVSNALKYINEEAKRFQINVSSVRPGELEPYQDKEGGMVRVADFSCKRVPVKLILEARYKALGEFFERLETNKSPMITIEGVNINKYEEIKPSIKADIDLNIYFLGK